VCLLLVIRAGLRLARFKTLYGWLKRLEKRSRRRVTANGEQVASVVRSIRQAIDLLGWRSGCLPQALAARFLLKRRGFDAVLCIGVKKRDDGSLQAHAWVEYEGQVVVGGIGPELASYTPLPDLDRVVL